MKNPRIPKQHSQLNLPIGTRVRFRTDKQSEGFLVGTIVDGIALEPGKYWLRRQHSFRPIKITAKRILAIEFHPTAPAPPAPRKPCPPPPAPMTAVSAQDAHGQVRIVSTRPFIRKPIAEVLASCPPPPAPGTRVIPFMPQADWEAMTRRGFNAKGTETGRFITTDLSKVEERLAAHLFSPESIAKDFLACLERGDLDGQLEELTAKVIARTKEARVTKRAEVTASLKKGDRVRIVGKLRPAWIVGTEGKVGEKSIAKVEVIFDKPQPRYGRSVKVPANCLEKLN
jgi:hypothetical protein